MSLKDAGKADLTTLLVSLRATGLMDETAKRKLCR